MIPTSEMKELFLCSVLILCLSVVNARPDKHGKKDDDCPECKLCPIDNECCFNYNGKMILDGESYNPNHKGHDGAPHVRSSYHDSCVNFTCVKGHIKKKYYCPVGWAAVGTACYQVGPMKMHYDQAEQWCMKIGHHHGDVKLAQLQTAEQAMQLAKNIKGLVSKIDCTQEGLFWLGASMREAGFQSWCDGSSVKDGYHNFHNEPSPKARIAAFSNMNYMLTDKWFYRSPHDLAYPLCQKMQCEKPITCDYKGKQYKCGEIMWRDPKCECSWIECGHDGSAKAVEKKKPCCVYEGEVFDNGAEVYVDKCSKLVCKNGKLVSYPHCGQDAAAGCEWMPLTYNGSSSCYLFNREQKTYDEASRFCASLDGKLAEITSEGENEAVEMWLLKYHEIYHSGMDVDVWLGGRADLCDNGKLGHFHWRSAESHKLPVEAVYEDFCDNKPCPEPTAHCLYTKLTGEKDKNYMCWANDACKQRKFFVCEKCSTCEHIYKNVCYRPSDRKFYNDGELVAAGHNPANAIGRGDYYEGLSCYEDYCVNGKIMRRNFVCTGEYKQVMRLTDDNLIDEAPVEKKEE